MLSKVKIGILGLVAAAMLSVSAPVQAQSPMQICVAREAEAIQKISSNRARANQMYGVIKWKFMQDLANAQAAGATPEELQELADDACQCIEHVRYVYDRQAKFDTLRGIQRLIQGNCPTGRKANVDRWGFSIRAWIEVEATRCCEEIQGMLMP